VLNTAPHSHVPLVLYFDTAFCPTGQMLKLSRIAADMYVIHTPPFAYFTHFPL